MKTYLCTDGNANVEIQAETPALAARGYVDDHFTPTPEEGTTWINVHVWDVESSDPTQAIKVTVDPKEPECPEGKHEWVASHDIVGGCKENPGVWGSGGGVVMVEVCAHCGLTRHINTWAQDPQDGTQGHTSVRYSDELHAAWEAAR